MAKDKQPLAERRALERAEAIEKTVKHFSRIEKDYVPEDEGNPFRSDSPLFNRLKKIVSKLSPVDRNIIILYAELGNIRSVGTVLNVSYRTAARHIARIKDAIWAEFNK